MSTVTNLLEDAEQVAAHMLVPNNILGGVLSTLVVHVEQMAQKVGYAVEGELPRLEKSLLGFVAPPLSEQEQLIADLQKQVDALTHQAPPEPPAPTPEQQRIAALEAQLAAQAQQQAPAEQQAPVEEVPAGQAQEATATQTAGEGSPS